ncbi:MAG TPA: DUF4395 domain-containing protein [Xanthomonadaceae bacterium]|nr:DUF4395 domain-containing protein [Xanthomonadaceae bacterium]
MAASPTLRRRIEAQGFRGLDDARLARIGPWLRWSPALCTLGMVAGVALESAPLLWSLAGVAFLGALLRFHPFDLLYNHGLRHVTGTGRLPHQGPQRRFACGVASAWLLATGLAFALGETTIGYLLGIPLIAVAGLVSVTNICIPSMVYNRMFERPW